MARDAAARHRRRRGVRDPRALVARQRDGAIEKGLRESGYRTVAAPGRFIVTGGQGPLREGELERARHWGEELRTAVTIE